MAHLGESLCDDDRQATTACDKADASGWRWGVREYDEWLWHPSGFFADRSRDRRGFLSPQFRSDWVRVRLVSSASVTDWDETIGAAAKSGINAGANGG